MSSVNVPNTVYLLTQDRNSKGRGCQQAADQMPVLYLILRAGADVDAGVWQAIGCGIFDFYKVFSRAFGEEEDGAVGSWNGRWGMSSLTSFSKME